MSRYIRVSKRGIVWMLVAVLAVSLFAFTVAKWDYIKAIWMDGEAYLERIGDELEEEVENGEEEKEVSDENA